MHAPETITVLVGWTSERPIIADQYVSAVTIPLALSPYPTDADVRAAIRWAKLEAFEAVQARARGSQWMPKVEMITSLNIAESQEG
jgi:hypothetical protein